MGKGRIIGPDQERLTFEDLGEIIVSEYEAQERKSLDRLQVSLTALRGFFFTSLALDIISSSGLQRWLASRR